MNQLKYALSYVIKQRNSIMKQCKIVSHLNRKRVYINKYKLNITLICMYFAVYIRLFIQLNCLILVLSY